MGILFPMRNYVIPPPPVSALPVRGSDKWFPVRRIYCVGRNYADHAIEMGGDPDRESPFFFSKPADALVVPGEAVAYPPATQALHHEVELVIAMGRGGAQISAEQALEHVFGYAVGVDLTRRDLQSEAKKQGRPWDMAKGFDQSAPLSEIVPVAEIGHPDSGAIQLSVNGEIRQQGDLAQMIWKPAEIISGLSQLITLRPGDLIMTGAPAGVGPVESGDLLDYRLPDWNLTGHTLVE